MLSEKKKKNQMDNNLLVKDFYERAKDLLKLRPAFNKIDFSGKVGEKGRLSVQVWGRKDIQDFEKLSPTERKEFIKRGFKESPPFVILSDNLSFSPKIEKEAKERRLAVFRSKLSQKMCRDRILESCYKFLDWEFLS
jgi:serine kinase of HPr protein (carbohydrate metabolism regulator)